MENHRPAAAEFCGNSISGCLASQSNPWCVLMTSQPSGLLASTQTAKAGYSKSHTPIMLSVTPAASQSLPRTMLSLPPLQA